MPVNLALQTTLTYSQFAIAAIVTVIVLVRSSRETRWVNLFALLAGTFTYFVESFADAMLLIWHPTPGQWNAFSAFGHYVPVWVMPVLYWSFGGQAVWMLAWLRRGVARGTLWKLYGFFAFTDLLFELPPLWRNVYVYYGDQPLVWPPLLALPMYLPFGNAMVPVGVAVAALLAERHLEARRMPWVVLPLCATAIFCGITLYGWPVALTLNSNAPHWLREVGGIVSIGISLLFMQLVANIFGKEKTS